jgi:dienelactone hydrolase
MRTGLTLLVLGLGLVACSQAFAAEPIPWEAKSNVFGSRREVAAMLVGYFEEMCRPKPFEARTGAEFKARQRALREKLLACAALWPLPERVALDLRYSPPLDHEWCTVRRAACQLWPEVYSTGLLYMPKQLAEKPAPAVMCPHGHWENGNAHPVVQTRCLVLAKMGYVVFSSTQNHYEDPAIGVSHQTLMIWNNIRALDLLESLPEVDKARIGVTACSGGGLQTQMLVAVDDRVKAATIVGMTCDYREIVFAGAAHCGCNHFPSIMRYTDEPELSANGLPAAVQYLTMNDWTKSFEANNYPTIRRLYELHGLKDRTDCHYEPTGHEYGKSKRERMYGWMEKWVRGKDPGGPVPEPETKTFPVETLLKLKAEVPADKGFSQISRLYAQKLHYSPPRIASRQEWEAYRGKMRAALRELLGEPLPRPARTTIPSVKTEEQGGLLIDRTLCPSEGNILVPTLLLRPAGAKGKLPVVVVCDGRGKDALLSATGEGSATELARKGALVVLPDVRFVGEMSLKAFAGLSQGLLTFKACSPLGEGSPDGFAGAWQRNALLWGRPLPGMAATDLLAVVDYVTGRPDADSSSVSLVARDAPAIAALFAAALDDRIASLDVDFQGKCFETRSLPLVPFVLQHGDILQWSALLAARTLSITGVPKEAGDPAWLRDAVKAAGGELRMQ